MRRAIVAALAAAVLAIPAPALAHNLTGVVRDTAGTALADAPVWLSIGRDARAARTDAAGHFSFSGVPTGAVQIAAMKKGLALGGATGQCIEDTNIEIVLSAGTPTRLRIINTHYAPIEGARLQRLALPGVFSVYVEDLTPLGFPSAPSDAKGLLLLPPLPAGAFLDVTVGHPGYADGALPALPVGEDLDFPLPDGVSIAGRITDGAGGGIARARVSIYRASGDGNTLLATEALSGPEGFYSALVPPGEYFVAAHHPKFGMPAPLIVRAGATGGEAVANVTMPAGRRVSGRALDTSDAAVPLAIFSYRVENYVVAETVSDGSGYFSLVVPPGKGALHIRAPRRMILGRDPRVNLEIGETADTDLGDVRFRPVPEVHGRVVTADGAAVNHALVTSTNVSPGVAVLTNEKGEFAAELERVPDEPMRFRAEHPLRFLRADFEVDPLKIEGREVRLGEYRPVAPAKDARWANDLKPLVGKPAPELDCRAWRNLPKGTETLRLADLRGKVIVLLLWAGFDRSDHNLQELAEFKALHAIYKDAGDVAIVSVHDAAGPPEAVAARVREMGIEFPVGIDSANSETFGRYRTGYVPQVVMVDKTGAVRFYVCDGKLLELIKMLRRE